MNSTDKYTLHTNIIITYNISKPIDSDNQNLLNINSPTLSQDSVIFIVAIININCVLSFVGCQQNGSQRACTVKSRETFSNCSVEHSQRIFYDICHL